MLHMGRCPRHLLWCHLQHVRGCTWQLCTWALLCICTCGGMLMHGPAWGPIAVPTVACPFVCINGKFMLGKPSCTCPWLSMGSCTCTCLSSFRCLSGNLWVWPFGKSGLVSA